MRKLNVTELGRMDAEMYKDSNKLPVTVILDDVRSLYNVGSVFRTSDAFRVERIILCGITATPDNNLVEIHKTALGAEQTVDWVYSDNCADVVKELNTKGYVTIVYEGLPLGFVKNLGNRCNSLHPQSRRIRMNIK